MNNREIFDSTLVYLKINSRVNRHLYLWVLTKQLSKQVTSTTKRQLKLCHLRHRLRIFLFCRKVMFGSQDIQVFVFLTMVYQICDAAMSIT